MLAFHSTSENRGVFSAQCLAPSVLEQESGECWLSTLLAKTGEPFPAVPGTVRSLAQTSLRRSRRYSFSLARAPSAQGLARGWHLVLGEGVRR